MEKIILDVYVHPISLICILYSSIYVVSFWRITVSFMVLQVDGR